MIRPKDVIGSNARIIERKRLLGRRMLWLAWATKCDQSLQ